MSTPNEILQWPSRDAAAWLAAVQNGAASVPDEFNWLGLAEGAGTNATQAATDEEALRWGEVAIGAYEGLLELSTSDGQRYPVLDSLLHLRALLIVRYGQGTRTPLLDPDEVIRLFHRYLPLTLRETLADIAVLPDLSIEDIRKLRRLKNMLGAVRLLAESGCIDERLHMQRWLALADKLP